jgi:hypothetical protein
MLQRIVTLGKFYSPATDHYPLVANAAVTCDKCKRTNLSCCIGYAAQDLCLSCAQAVVDSVLLTTEAGSSGSPPPTMMRELLAAVCEYC